MIAVVRYFMYVCRTHWRGPASPIDEDELLEENDNVVKIDDSDYGR